MSEAAPPARTYDYSGVAGNSMSVAGWTLVSRVTGFVRVAVVAAVLGPTFFGNLYQSTNFLPNLIYELLAGALIASLLVPPLVRHLDLGDRGAVERVAGGFLGLSMVAFGVVALVIAVAGPLVIQLFTLGVADDQARADQQEAGWLLLVLAIPQLLCYGLAGTGAAVQNAHGRFALPAAAPAVENLGVIATLGATAALFGTGTDVGEVGTAQLLVLGLGSTAAVGLHAALQWWGARGVGVVLRPRAGWRDPDVRAIARLAVPSLGYAALTALRYLGILVVAGSIPGGVVAFLMALNFFNLPVAIGAKPVSAALLPHLSRLHQEARDRAFRDEWVAGLGLAFFLTVPAAVAYVVLAGPLAAAVSFGEMADRRGVELIAVSLAALGLGVIGESALQVSTIASYARFDARAPLRAMAVRAAIFVPGMVLALVAFDDLQLLAVLGLALAVSDLVSGAVLGRHLDAVLPASDDRALRALARCVVAAAVMAVPAAAVGWGLPALTGGRLHLVGVALAAVVGAAVFLGVQLAFGAREPHQLRAGLARREVAAA